MQQILNEEYLLPRVTEKVFIHDEYPKFSTQLCKTFPEGVFNLRKYSEGLISLSKELPQLFCVQIGSCVFQVSLGFSRFPGMNLNS